MPIDARYEALHAEHLALHREAAELRLQVVRLTDRFENSRRIANSALAELGEKNRQAHEKAAHAR